MKKQHEVDLAEAINQLPHLSQHQQNAIARTIMDCANRNKKKRPVLRLVSTNVDVAPLVRVGSIAR